MPEFRLFHLNDCLTNPMKGGRGEQVRLINSECGAEKVDLHLNRLAPGEPGGHYHSHSVADNVYIVKSGIGRLIVDGNEHMLREDDVVYIPAGSKHSLQNASDTQSFEIFEIYAPAGNQFDFVVDGKDIGSG